MKRIRKNEKPKNFKKTVKKIFEYIGEYKFAIFFVAIFAILGTVFQVAGPKVMGKATTELAEGLMKSINGTGGIDFVIIFKILIFTFGLYLAGSVFRFLHGYIMSGITQKTIFRMRREISEKIDRMPAKYFEGRPYGEVLSRITNDVDSLGTGLNQSITTVITSISTIIGVIVMMLSISSIMTIIAFIMIPLSFLLMGILMRISQKEFRAQQKYLGDINGQIEEDFSGQRIIKAFTYEDEAKKNFDVTNNKLFNAAYRAQFFSGFMGPIMWFLENLGYVGVAVSGGFLAIKGIVTIGDIQAFIQYVQSLIQPMTEMAQVTNQIQTMVAAAERVFEFLEEDEEEESAEVFNASGDEIKGAVRFDHVRFGYSDEKDVIKDFSVNIKPGEKIAIVGPTGAGKTTIVKLLMRFYDIKGGAIYLDGRDIRTFRRHDLRKHFAMVLQDTWLFADTIKENIRYGKPGATDEEVIEAAKAACAHHFIKTLPGGYNMKLNEDATNISEGQRQLLTIARAIIADRKVLMLDEATSSVDTRTEERIQEAMDHLMKGRTSFIIAHRLSTIENADLILVMDHGNIIEQGNHEELISKKGLYANLYNSQFENI